MKKSFVILIMAVVAISLFVGCKNEPEVKGYEVGDKGPAGGIIVYVADEVQTSTYTDASGEKQELKWKYLEVASKDALNTVTSETGKYSWGPSASTDYKTDTAIGSGWSNTKKLEAAGINNFPAAKACADYSVNGEDGKIYDDWFLPSKDELNEMYKSKTTVGNFLENAYWTSSEVTNKENIWIQTFHPKGNGAQNELSRDSYTFVRPIRAFQ